MGHPQESGFGKQAAMPRAVPVSTTALLSSDILSPKRWATRQTAFVTANAAVLTIGVADLTLLYGVVKEVNAARKGECRAF
jgi:hypothetical protein